MSIEKTHRANPKHFKFACAAVIFLVIAAFIIGGLLFFNRTIILNEITLEAGTPITPEIFFEKKVSEDVSIATVPDTSVPGVYTIEIHVNKKAYPCELTIVDTVPPSASAKETIHAWGGVLPDAAECVQNIQDATQVTIEWLNAPNLDTEGDHIGTVVLKDAAHNQTQVQVVLSVTVDTVAPVIAGVQDYTLYVGDTLDYTANISVTDDKDPSPSLIVDDSTLDAKTPGVYQITYTALDGSKNQTVKTCSIKLLADTEAPIIEGVSDFTTCINLPIDYKSGISVSDNANALPSLTIHDSDVTFAASGIYEVIYTATDASSNTTTATARIEVVEDTTAPEIKGAADRKIPVGTTFDYKSVVTVSDDWDAAPTLSITGDFDATTVGNYTVTYTATDFTGNTAVKECKYTVGKDTTPPTVVPENFTVYVGDSVSYKKHVSVTDDFYGTPKLNINNSNVDLNTAGVYTVTYTATDASGNSASASSTVTVINKPTTEELVVSMAKDVLKRIINDKMTVMEKAFAIYLWTRKTIKYIGTSDKSNWVDGAYEGFTTHRGDCFTYYAVARALLTQAGIDNLEVTRDSTTTTHYWNLINIGTGWYHFDTCLFLTGTGKIFMLTDAEVFEWDANHKQGGHTYKASLLPACATTSVQHMVDYNNWKIINP